jgi:hypothetical protein
LVQERNRVPVVFQFEIPVRAQTGPSRSAGSLLHWRTIKERAMPGDTELLEYLYDHFNARDMESALGPTSTDTRASASIGRDHLTARDLKGNLLFDKMGNYIFRIEDGLIRCFDIFGAAPSWARGKESPSGRSSFREALKSLPI